MKEFTVTEEHLKLLKNLQFRYDDDIEFGAPAVDPKRPYGNSDVYCDIAEIIGLEPEGVEDAYGDRDFTRDQLDYMKNLHKEMTTVLQILGASGEATPGTYTSSNYGVDWNKV